MGRLVDEDAVYDYLTGKFNEFDISVFKNEFAGKILDELCDIPTAYDVEKVVAELEANTSLFVPAIPTETAVNIVKRGGVK